MLEFFYYDVKCGIQQAFAQNLSSQVQITREDDIKPNQLEMKYHIKIDWIGLYSTNISILFW